MGHTVVKQKTTTTRLVPNCRALGQMVSNVQQGEAQSRPKPKRGREACRMRGSSDLLKQLTDHTIMTLYGRNHTNMPHQHKCLCPDKVIEATNASFTDPTPKSQCRKVDAQRRIVMLKLIMGNTAKYSCMAGEDPPPKGKSNAK